MTKHTAYLTAFLKDLEKQGIACNMDANVLIVKHHEKTLEFLIADTPLAMGAEKPQHVIPFDYLVNSRQKLCGMILSQLKMNQKIFARKCDVKKVEKADAEIFFNQHHLLGATGSAYNLGLFYEGELVALASFSKGRKMNRLAAHERSFELIRFCNKTGLTVTGGLSRLLKSFFELKEAGDIMTYVDKQFSDGQSFMKAGFTLHSEKVAQQFLIHRKTFVRKLYQGEKYDVLKFYLSENAGSIKMVYKAKMK